MTACVRVGAESTGTVEQALAAELERLEREHNAGERFPRRSVDVRRGRPLTMTNPDSPTHDETGDRKMSEQTATLDAMPDAASTHMSRWTGSASSCTGGPATACRLSRSRTPRASTPTGALQALLLEVHRDGVDVAGSPTAAGA